MCSARVVQDVQEKVFAHVCCSAQGVNFNGCKIKIGVCGARNGLGLCFDYVCPSSYICRFQVLGLFFSVFWLLGKCFLCLDFEYFSEKLKLLPPAHISGRFLKSFL